MQQDQTDDALMAEVAAGSRVALARLMDRHAGRSLRLARRIVGNVSDAEEVVQDCFVQVWRHAGRWRGDQARFATWLYRIVVNRSLSVVRRGGRRRFEPLDEDLGLTCPQPDPFAEVAGRELASAAGAAMAALPDRQRAAMALCVDEGLTCAEAAAVMGVTVATMESLLVRARRRLRHHLDLEPGTQGTGATGKPRR